METKKEGASLHFDSESFNAEIYSRVARKAMLRDVILVDSVFSFKVEVLNAAQEEEQSINPRFEGKPEETFSDNDFVVGKYLWTVEIKHKRKRGLHLRSTYVLVYSGLKDEPEDYKRLYFSKLARFTSYPYFRAHTAAHVASAGLSLPPLPSLHDRVD